MTAQRRLFTFLGNPGSQYENTRHNSAWMLLEQLDEVYALSWQMKFRGQFAEYQAPGNQSKGTQMPGTLFYRFHGYMNKSGEGLKDISSFYRIPNSHITVVYDELDLAPGQWKVQNGGGLKGHNGLRSIHQMLGTKDFRRIAIGIGRPPHPGFEINRWVLSGFSEEDRADMMRAFSEIREWFGPSGCGPE